MPQNSFYIEPISEEEADFLKKRYQKEISRFFRALRIGLICCITIPLVIGVIISLTINFAPRTYIDRDYPPVDTGMVIIATLIAGLFFLLLIGLGFLGTYYFNIRGLALDVKRGQKIVEQAMVIDKKFMPHNHTYHFYINSKGRLSIEVSEHDYGRFETGDEINLEYTRYGKIDLGYF